MDKTVLLMIDMTYRQTTINSQAVGAPQKEPATLACKRGHTLSTNYDAMLEVYDAKGQHFEVAALCVQCMIDDYQMLPPAEPTRTSVDRALRGEP